MRDRTEKEVRFSARKIKKRAELGSFQGRGFAGIAADLRLKACCPNAGATPASSPYLDALEDTDASVLVVSEAQGRA